MDGADLILGLAPFLVGDRNLPLRHLTAATASFAFVALTVSSALACGEERWLVKVGADRDISKVDLNPRPTTIAALAAIKAPPNPNSRQSIRFGPTELHAYSLSAKLTLIKREDDWDYHIVLRDRSATMIVEAANPACAPNSAVVAQIAGVRRVINQRFGKVTGRRAGLSVPVTVVGLGFFDNLHGQEGVARNGIELHPLLSISFD